MIPALVLTAGLGTRLDPLTRLIAKAAVPVAGHSLVERVLEWLQRQSVPAAVLNLHFRPDTITAVVGDGAHLGVPVRYSWEPVLLGSAGGPRLALPLLAGPTGGEDFLIVNGDTLTDFDLAPMLEAHRQSGAAVTLAVVSNPAPHRYNGLLVDDEDRVCGFVPKGHIQPSWHFVGVQIAGPAVFMPLPIGQPAETVAGIYKRMVDDSPSQVGVWKVNAAFLDVGTPRDYLAASLQLAGITGPGSVIEGRETVVSPLAEVARSVVWPGATIAAGVRIHSCVVASGVTLVSGFEAERKVIMPAELVRPGDVCEVQGGVALYPI